MATTVQLIRSFNRNDSAERVRAMREHAHEEPNGILAPWMAAIAFWEEGEIEEARRLAEYQLVDSPKDFRMLVICLDASIRAEDSERTLSYARRVIEAENPAKGIRRVNKVLRILLWPLLLLGYGRGLDHEPDAFEAWEQWARAYVDMRAQGSPAPDTPPP
jgi:hypothetical protein